MIQIVKDTKGNAIVILSPLLPSHLVFLPLSNIFFYQFLTNSPRETSLHMQLKEIIYLIKHMIPLITKCTIIMLIYYIYIVYRRCEFDPCIKKILWRRIWKPTPVFLPGESHERGAWQAAVHGVAELDTAEWLN